MARAEALTAQLAAAHHRLTTHAPGWHLPPDPPPDPDPPPF